MDKALVIIPDNNKGKFIAKGFAQAFGELSYFVITKKIFDIDINEINSTSPDIIFTFWSGLSDKDNLLNFISDYTGENSIFIHCAEYLNDIPKQLRKKIKHYIFSSDSKTKRNLYLPAISYKEYKTKFSGYRYNIVFSGNPAKDNREKILSKLVYNFGAINIYCRSFDFYKSVEEIEKKLLLNEYFLELYKQSYKGYVETQSELAKIYSSAKINLSLENDRKKPISYRTLEVLASGGFLITEYNSELVKYFDDGKDLETYKTDDDLVDKIRFYMKNLNISQMISTRGRRNTASNFLYTDRLKNMLKVIYGKDISNR